MWSTSKLEALNSTSPTNFWNYNTPSLQTLNMQSLIIKLFVIWHFKLSIYNETQFILFLSFMSDNFWQEKKTTLKTMTYPCLLWYQGQNAMK